MVLVVKNSLANAGDIRDVSSIPGLGRSLKKEIATDSSTLAWRTAWQRSLVGYIAEWDTTEQLTLSFSLYNYGIFFFFTPFEGFYSWKDLSWSVTKSWTQLSYFTFTFHFHTLEKEMATHSSDLAWRIPGTGEPGGLLSMGSHRVGHDWSDLAAAAAARQKQRNEINNKKNLN